MSQEKSWY